MPGHHSSHHSSSHHSSSHHSSSSHIHHNSSTHLHTHHTPTSGVGVPGIVVGRRSSGRGCIQAFVVIFIVVFAIAGIAIYMSVKAASNAISSFTSSNTSASDLKIDPTVIADVQIMTKALDSRIPAWMAQNDTVVHHLSASDAGLPSDFNTKEVVYGHCASSQFYVFVLNVTKPDGISADTEGYEYVPGGTPQNCTPAGWTVMTSENAASDWYFVTLNTLAATSTASAN